MTDTDEPVGGRDGADRDQRLHASRHQAAPSGFNADRGAAELPEGPEEAPGNRGWNEASAEAPESLEGAVRRAGNPQNGEPIHPDADADPRP